MAVNHYENFPVGSLVLPKRLREPTHAIYAYCRTADDMADEGDTDDVTRLTQLNSLKSELDLLANNQEPTLILMKRLNQQAIGPFAIPLQPFYDLLSAFSQDIRVKRYDNEAMLLDYCSRSANPVGLMMLHLFKKTDHQSILQSNRICTALQLINFIQDVAIDWHKNRVYIPITDLHQFGVNEDDIANNSESQAFKQLIEHQVDRAQALLSAGAPLAKNISGRMGFELRLIVAGGQKILDKIQQNQYCVLTKRPKLHAWDYMNLIKAACFFKY